MGTISKGRRVNATVLHTAAVDMATFRKFTQVDATAADPPQADPASKMRNPSGPAVQATARTPKDTGDRK